MADPAMTEEWRQYFESGNPDAGYQLKDQVTVKVVTDAAKLMADKLLVRKNVVSN